MANPVEAIDADLHGVVDEAERRRYNFARTKLNLRSDTILMTVSTPKTGTGSTRHNHATTLATTP